MDIIGREYQILAVGRPYTGSIAKIANSNRTMMMLMTVVVVVLEVVMQVVVMVVVVMEVVVVEVW